jgi:superfamily II DNA or RNA helicase
MTAGLDRTVVPLVPRVSASGLVLRHYQQRVLDSWVAAGRQGVAVAPCGAGKTMIGVAAIAATPTRALVLVHTLDLARQWVDRRALLEDADVGLVGGGKKSMGARVVVATMQTIAKLHWWERFDWLRDFGLVIVDEAHHTPCASLLGILSSAPGRYRLGLTATPTRQDGLEDWLTWAVGPTVGRITTSELEAEGATMRPVIKRVRTGWCPDDFNDWHEVGNQIVDADDRNATISREAAQLIDGGRQVLVLTERVEHARRLAESIGDARAIVGDLADGERTAALDALRSGSLRCAVATQLADEGLDVPDLGAVVLAWPSRNLGAVQQRIGRACRPGAGKRPPVVVDLRDDYGVFKGYARSRDQLYEDLGW